MKNKFPLFVLLLSFVLWQGCGSKTEVNDEEVAKADVVKISVAQTAAAKREMLAKASAKRAEERSQEIAERARVTPTYKDASGKTVYVRAEVDPSYTGGVDGMRKYLKENLKYPDAARKSGVEGTVFVDFVVDEKGHVRQVVATDAVGEDVDFSLKEESVRVVASMPGWKAGLQQGKAVDVSFSIPITFEIVN